jgi:hypothetical protein
LFGDRTKSRRRKIQPREQCRNFHGLCQFHESV